MGAVRSTVTEEAFKPAADPILLAESTTEAEDRPKMTVPSEQEATVTVIEEPEAAEGVNAQPVAVPALEKSDAVNPETVSEKVRI